MKSEPFGIALTPRRRIVDGTGWGTPAGVDILHAQKKSPAGRPRLRPRIERRERMTQMQMARLARCEACDSHGIKNTASARKREIAMPTLDAIHWGPASKATPKHLIILCHGLGADAYDLIDLASSWQHACPDAMFASVHAPFPHDSGFGRQWWSVGDRSPSHAEAGVRAAAPYLHGFIDAELVRLNLPADAYAIMGFSQGAMMSLFAGLRHPTAPRAILAFSGALVAPDSLAAELTNLAPVLLVHGENDEAVPVSRSRDAEAVLKAARVPVEGHYIPRLGHGLDDTGIALGALALQRGFS